ncbi:hypothetical protein BOH66_07895 [Microbacterium aurum]|uniref:Uncharacterized protein n=1 Tax=Microbacterium aurum TaxID=36805 RepID=A0A1P8U7U5_9MICO|nr:hypothetical protein [Microbacterium aurum]APZ34177.1 hypothetical protein BOH66_07895 [Microbacterium aurum]MBM7827995.1 hypothetical protein [Microbacterium aurum]
MDPTAPADDRRRRRVLIALIAAGLVLALLVSVGIYGLLRGPAPRTEPAPTGTAAPTITAPPTGTSPAGPAPVSQLGGPETFARQVAQALFGWDTTNGYGPADYAQVIVDVAAGEEADALAGDVRAYLPGAEAWAQLRQHQTRQWLSIQEMFVPEAWETATSQAAPGQIPEGAVAYTIEGTRHRDGTWGTEPVEASRPIVFTVFIVCAPVVTNRGITGTHCELLRLSQLDNPLR